MGISSSGLVSGLDVESIVSQMSAIEKRPIQKLQQKEAEYQVQLSAYGSLQGSLTGLKSALSNLQSENDFKKFKAESGDEELFTASASSSAAAGSYSVEVVQLAQVHKMATQEAFSDAALLGEGTIHLQVGDGFAVDIAVSATDTIADVAAAINDADAGVDAALIYDGTGYFLSMAARETGSSNTIAVTVDDGDGNLTDDSGLSRIVNGKAALTQSQEAKNAVIKIDDLIRIERDTNTIDDVIAGVTFNLVSSPASPDNKTSLKVERDNSAIVSGINAFAEAYNKLVDAFDTHQSYNKQTGAAGVLFGDNTTNILRRNLAGLLRYSVSGSEGLSSLSDLGVDLKNNRLEVDSAKLNDVLESNFEGVMQFFTIDDSSSEGFAVQLVESLRKLTDSRDGAIAARESGINDSIEDIHDQIERIERRALASEKLTRSRFESLELLLGQFQSTSNFLNQQLTNLSNLSKQIAGR